jgi:nitroimidazol reductase NimA-like FMN-containing flavoprotein (pyridoxamine 5'-phosphate oxidase superfamily)
MPGYGVPDTVEGALPWAWAEERMATCRNFYIASTRPDGRPHVMPVWGVWTDGLFVFSTAITSVKSENLKKNPKMAFSADAEPDSLIVEGEARITPLEEVPGFVSAYKKKYDYTIKEGPVWSMRPRVAFGFIGDDSFPTTATRWRWEL